MFFSRLAQEFERLSEKLAPIPTDPAHRFSKAVQSGDVNFALALLSPTPPPLADGTVCSPLDPFRSVFNKQKGTLAIHSAAEHAQVEIVRSLITQYGVSPEQFDTQGNTPLHYAASCIQPSALELVKILVTEFNVSVTVKNAMGQTPYDVSKQDRVRQYLLPIQLQRETQECLDNGGQGLPPGIDLGGLSLNSHLPPPPMAVGGGYPTNYGSPSGSNAPSINSVGKYTVPSYDTDRSKQVLTQSMVQPFQPPVYNAPPFQHIPSSTPTSKHDSNYTHYQAPEQTGCTSIMNSSVNLVAPPDTNIPSLPNDAGESPASEINTDIPMSNQLSVAQTNPPTSQSQVDTLNKLPLAPLSGSLAPNSGYARRGFSTAAVLPSNAKYKPDGFHSSSSDVSLQQKYGHDSSVTGPPSGQFRAQNLGPPPSGGSCVPYTGYPAAGANTNQYSAYAAGGLARPRYPTYDAVSNTVGAAHGYMTYQQPSMPTPQYNVYTPASSNESQHPTTTNYGNYHHSNTQTPDYSNQFQGAQYYSNEAYNYSVNPVVSEEYYSQQQDVQYDNQNQYYYSQQPYQYASVTNSYNMPESGIPTSSSDGFQTGDSNQRYNETYQDQNVTSPFTDSLSPMTEYDFGQSPSELVAVESTDRSQSVSSANDLFSSPPSGDSNISVSFKNVNAIAVESTRRESSVTSASELFSSPSSMDSSPPINDNIQESIASIPIESSIHVEDETQNPPAQEQPTTNDTKTELSIEDSMLPPPPFAIDNFQHTETDYIDDLPPPPMIDISLS